MVGIYTNVPQESCILLPDFHFPWIMAEIIKLLVGSVKVEGKRTETRRLLDDVPLWKDLWEANEYLVIGMILGTLGQFHGSMAQSVNALINISLLKSV